MAEASDEDHLAHAAANARIMVSVDVDFASLHTQWQRSVPVAVLLGIPLYSNAAGIILIVSALLGKGAAKGTVLAFMMSLVALSLPEMIILRKVLKPRLIAIFVGVVALSIVITGYLFNLVI